MGKKYIIELQDEPLLQESMPFGPELYRVNGFNSLVFDKNGLEKLTPYEEVEKKSVDENKGFLDGYTAGHHDGYEQGMIDAWAAAEKITIMDESKVISLFNKCYYSLNTKGQVFQKYFPQEAVEKLKEYSRESDIRVGDEVVYSSPHGNKNPMVITRITQDMSDGTCSFDAIYQDGTINEDGALRLVEKTGRHFDEIEKLLGKMNEGENNE